MFESTQIVGLREAAGDLADYKQIFRPLDLQQASARPFQQLGMLRENQEMLGRIRWERDLSARAFQTAMPLGLMSQVLGAGFLAEINRIQSYGVGTAAERAVRSAGLDYDRIVGPTPRSIGLTAAMQGLVLEHPATRALDDLSARLAFSVRDLYAEVAGLSAGLVDLTPSLREAPALAVYTTTRSVALTQGGSMELLEAHQDEDTEEILDEYVDEIERRLHTLGSAFAEIYRGALLALEGQRPGWCRHISVSLRELTAHLLGHLAPDHELVRFFPKPDKTIWSREEFTWRARLQYVYRTVAVDSYARMAENHIEITLALFFPANAGVHALSAPLTRRQARVFTRQVQGCIWALLEAADV